MPKIISFYVVHFSRYTVYLLCILCFINCKESIRPIKEDTQAVTHQKKSEFQIIDSIFATHVSYKSLEFDFPVGKPPLNGYYNAQEFGENNHLGEDWNGVGGGNSDMGDPIYSISNGYVSFVKDIGGGWGNVIRIIHAYNGSYYESVYAHCKTVHVKEKQFIKRGEKIGSIGNANGAYLAHLHLELRDRIFMDIGAGYAADTEGYVNPTQFIKTN